MAGGGQIEILVVDDESEVRSMLGQFLRRSGYQVREAGDGEEALRVLSGHAPTVQLLVTDIVMPGMSGCELAREVRRAHPHIRRLYISGFPCGALEPGAVLIKKPFNLHSLLQHVQQALSESSDDQAAGVSAGS